MLIGNPAIADSAIATLRQIGGDTGSPNDFKVSSMSLPIVVRLQGTNVDEGKRILAESGLSLIAADTMADAAAQVVASVA